MKRPQKLSGEVKRILGEQYNQHLSKPIYTVMLPCKHLRLEITQAKDQLLTCPKCHKKSYFIYSPLGNHKWT